MCGTTDQMRGSVGFLAVTFDTGWLGDIVFIVSKLVQGFEVS